MKYCPIDGDEYLDGIDRCPEHDVELVDEAPEEEDALSWVDRFNDRAAVRIAFLLFLLASIVYAITGAIAAFIFLMATQAGWEHHDKSALFSSVQTIAFPIAICALGILVAALVLRTYLNLTFREEAGDLAPAEPRATGGISAGLMRLLFVLTILFAIVWAGTTVAKSQDEAELRAGQRIGFGVEPGTPSGTYLTLTALNYGSYSCGVASLAVMGASLMVRTYKRNTRTVRNSVAS